MRKMALASIIAISWVFLVVGPLSTSAQAATASFVKTDAATMGTWIGAYGADGYSVSQDTDTKTPSYAQVSFSGTKNYIWQSSTTVVHGLERPESPSSRIAAAWWSSSFTINVNLTDGKTHQVALYALDWDTSTRSETVNVFDAATGALLNSQALAVGSFHNGEYLVWSVTGSVQFEVVQDAGPNAVISGVFLDTPQSTTGAAAPANTALPVITGTAQVGKVLTSSTGTWTGATSFAYQWAGNGSAISGATASTYTPVAGDVGHTLTATVKATGSGGAKSATSAATATVLAAAPVNSQLPVISGTAQVGKAQTSSTGTWTGATSFGYQWAGNGAAIAGATASTYTPVATDVGHTLTAAVTATGAGGAASATSAPTVPIVAASSSSSGGSGSGAGSFTALHTYYISPTGSDSNNGLTTATAWKTPHHSIVCGDVIIAAPGNYGGSSSPFGAGSWGAVSNCPSTSGGIDGAGGVYFATVLCAGPYLTSCAVSATSGEAFRVDQSNWAVEGFSASAPSAACFSGTSETSTTLHHIAFINNLASNCGNAGFDTYSWTSPGGVDQTAVVGAIAFNSAHTASLCGSGVSIIPDNGPDASAGTHVFAAGIFSYGNVNGANCAGGAGSGTTDGEGIIFDSWACSSFSHQGVAEQNVLWGNGSAGFEAYPNCTAANDLATYIVKNNTSYGNFQDAHHTGSSNGEIDLQNVSPSTGSYFVENNIFQATMATPGGATQSGSFGYPVFGAEIACSNNCSPKMTVASNYIWKSHAPTSTSAGNPNTDAWANGARYTSSFPFGTNTYNTAGFANPGALPTMAPNCSGYATTTACMAGTGVVADLTPSGGAVGGGYQPPGSCAADAYFPTWLKGVVSLSWSGSALNENAGLITKPCGM